MVMSLFCKIFLLFLLLLFVWLYWSSSFDFYLKREKSSVFECGFDVKDNSRLPFSYRFFFFLILFLIFDMELIVILSLPFVLNLGILSVFGLILFLGFLFFSVLEEWRRGFLDWF